MTLTPRQRALIEEVASVMEDGCRETGHCLHKTLSWRLRAEFLAEPAAGALCAECATWAVKWRDDRISELEASLKVQDRATLTISDAVTRMQKAERVAETYSVKNWLSEEDLITLLCRLGLFREGSMWCTSDGGEGQFVVSHETAMHEIRRWLCTLPMSPGVLALRAANTKAKKKVLGT